MKTKKNIKMSLFRVEEPGRVAGLRFNNFSNLRHTILVYSNNNENNNYYYYYYCYFTDSDVRNFKKISISLTIPLHRSRGDCVENWLSCEKLIVQIRGTT